MIYFRFFYMFCCGAVFATEADFFKKIPEVGKESVRIKNEKVKEVNAKEGAWLENVTAENVKVKKVFCAKTFKAKKVDFDDCMARMEDSFVGSICGLAVCQIYHSVVQNIDMKGYLIAYFLKVNKIKLTGKCAFNDSEIGSANIDIVDRIELKNTKINLLTVSSTKDKQPVVFLKNSTVNKIVFLGQKGKILKRDYSSYVQIVENGTQEVLF